MEEVRFTGSPTYSENGTYYVPRPASFNYTGDPSPELDMAWEKLYWGIPPGKPYITSTVITFYIYRSLRDHVRGGSQGPL